MAVVRILVDGYSLLHAWRDLAPEAPRHSARAREALIRVLTQYADSSGTPVTLFFDGAGGPKDAPKKEEPKKEAPKAEAKKEEPKKEAPKAEAKKEEPKKEAPKKG